LLTRGSRAPERRGPGSGRATSAADESVSDVREQERALALRGIGDGSSRRHPRRPSRDEGTSATGRIGSAPPDRPAVVASERAARHETRREGQWQASGSGRQTVAVERRLQDPLAFAHERAREYETTSETDAGRLKGVTGAGGTISLWLQPAWDAMSQDDASFVRIGDDRIRVYKSATHLRFEVTDANGQPIAVDMPFTDWNPGEWHHLLTTWDGRNAPHVISFFVDGNIVGQSQYQGEIELPRKPKLYVGTNAPDQPVAPGLVADVKVHTRPLSLEAVSRWFEESRPPRH
jgi:hypothetical protein